MINKPTTLEFFSELGNHQDSFDAVDSEALFTQGVLCSSSGLLHKYMYLLYYCSIANGSSITNGSSI